MYIWFKISPDCITGIFLIEFSKVKLDMVNCIKVRWSKIRLSPDMHAFEIINHLLQRYAFLKEFTEICMLLQKCFGKYMHLL